MRASAVTRAERGQGDSVEVVLTTVEGDAFAKGHLIVHSGTAVATPEIYAIAKKHRRCFGWTVTHVPTGHSVISGIPTRKCALHAARLLAHLDVDWSFRDPAESKRLSSNARLQIDVISIAARAGGYA